MILICDNCLNSFKSKERSIKRVESAKNHFCCKTCRNKFGTVYTKCDNCDKSIKKTKNQYIKCNHHFCSSSCAAKYTNAHKTKGTRISKMEKYFQERLPTLYPSIKFTFNEKSEINSELDIYIRDLKLAFELNGIFHYEPIYGIDKLKQIQNNDQRKFQACLEKNIELVILDTSSVKYFKPKNVQKYLDIICSIIDQKVSGL